MTDLNSAKNKVQTSNSPSAKSFSTFSAIICAWLNCKVRADAQIDMIDDVAAIKPLQNVVALLADGEDLDRLAVGEKLVGMLAGELGDLRVEAAAQAALGGANDEQMDLVPAGAGEQGRRVIAPRHGGGEIGEHRGHALRIGARGDRCFLGAAQFRRRHHLHGLGDLARRLHRGDAIA